MAREEACPGGDDALGVMAVRDRKHVLRERALVNGGLGKQRTAPRNMRQGGMGDETVWGGGSTSRGGGGAMAAAETTRRSIVKLP